MIVKCAYCGWLPLADIEALHEKAWEKHVAEQHPEWLPTPDPLSSDGDRGADAKTAITAHNDGEQTP